MPPNAPYGAILENPKQFGNGGDNEIRTRDLCVANASLYQLSHTPVSNRKNAVFYFVAPPFIMVEMVRVELTS